VRALRGTTPDRLIRAALLAALSLAPHNAASATAPGAGAVACAAPAAAEAGAAVLAAGGNAVDAAVATALALAVVHPQAGNLGGGGFAVVRIGAQLAALDFRETAPAAATRSMFLSEVGAAVAERSLVGPLAAGVPGSPAGLFELHRRFGRLPWRDVVAPAVRLAGEGFTVTPRLSAAVAAARSLLGRFAESAAVWLPDGKPPEAGTRMTIPALAVALRAYAAGGPGALTSGDRAEAIATAARRHGGIVTVADLAAYRPKWREPVRFLAFGWDVASMPLPSSGGIILAESAGMLERLGWATLPAGSPERPHLLAEVWRRAFADRTLLADPSSTLAGPRELLAADWLARRAGGIDRRRATRSGTVGPWPGAGGESSETTHLSVVDVDGNAVALTTTLNGSFGCGLLVPEVGFLLNNEMDDFTTAPGQPNLYGLIQGEANAVAPGKRMLSSMSPTLAWRGAELLALGSPGGSHIPTATLQTLLAVVVDGAPVQAAVARARIHHQWQPDELVYESGALTPDQLVELGRRGHSLRSADELGEVHAVFRDGSGAITAAADPRGPGATATAPSRPAGATRRAHRHRG